MTDTTEARAAALLDKIALPFGLFEKAHKISGKEWEDYRKFNIPLIADALRAERDDALNFFYEGQPL